MLERIDYPDGLPVKVELLNLTHYPWHMHDDIQILYVLDGELELKLTYSRYRLVPGSIHIIHNDDVHGMRGLTEKNLVALLSLNMTYFSKFHRDLDTQIFTTRSGTDVATHKKQLLLRTHIFSLISEFYGQNPGHGERVAAASHDLMNALFRDFRGFFVDPRSRTFERKVSHDTYQSERVGRVVSRVYRDYPYKLSLADIAKREQVNGYYLSHLFRAYAGLSFRAFVSMVRVEMSESELLSTTEPISQISQNVGFSNAKYYVENFTNWFGCHPGEYRRLYAGEILGKSLPVMETLPPERIAAAPAPYASERTPLPHGDERIVCVCDLRKAAANPARTETGPDADALRRLYAPGRDHAACLSFLAEALAEPRGVAPATRPADASDDPTGLLCTGGLKTPLRWVRAFWDRLFPDIAARSDDYLMTRRGADVRILFGNGDAEKVLRYAFRFAGMSGRYRVTEHRLSPALSCTALWRRLDFETPLPEEIFRQIEAMSAPRITFDTLPGPDGYATETRVMPEEVVLLELSAAVDS